MGKTVDKVYTVEYSNSVSGSGISYVDDVAFTTKDEVVKYLANKGYQLTTDKELVELYKCTNSTIFDEAIIQEMVLR